MPACVLAVVCSHVSRSHAKQLATSEEVWPVLCMFQRVALRVSRSTASQKSNRAHTQTHTQQFVHTHTQELWLMGLWEWEPMWDGWRDQMCLWAAEFRIGFLADSWSGYVHLCTHSQSHTRTHTHTHGFRAVAEETQVAHGSLVCHIATVLSHWVSLACSKIHCGTAQVYLCCHLPQPRLTVRKTCHITLSLSYHSFLAFLALS